MNDVFSFISNHLLLTYALAGVIFLLIIVEFLRQKRQSFSVTVPEAVQLINKQNALIIDIRSPENFKNGHIIDAQSLPLKDLTDNKKIEKYKNRVLLIVCGSGLEANKIAASLIKRGFNTYALAGGIRAWVDAELPLIKG